MHTLHTLQSIKTTRAKRRLGRGPGSSKGKTAGRGHKGYKARSGSSTRVGFEGGQMPFIMRIPKLKGFHNINQKIYQVLNVGDIARYATKGTLTKDILMTAGFLRKGEYLKILGTGKLDGAVMIEADAVSASARAIIEKAGGSVTITK